MLLFVEGYVMGQDLDLSSGLAVRRGELVEAGLGGAIDELVHFGLLTGMHGERRRFVLARHLLHGRQHNTRLCVSPAGARLPMPQPERQPSPPPRPRRRDPPVAVGLPIAPPPQQPPPPPQPVQPQQPPPPTPPPTAPALPPSARRRPTCCVWGFLTTGLPVVHMLLLSISTKYILCQHTAHRRPLQRAGDDHHTQAPKRSRVSFSCISPVCVRLCSITPIANLTQAVRSHFTLSAAAPARNYRVP